MKSKFGDAIKTVGDAQDKVNSIQCKQIDIQTCVGGE